MADRRRFIQLLGRLGKKVTGALPQAMLESRSGIGTCCNLLRTRSAEGFHTTFFSQSGVISDFTQNASYWDARLNSQRKPWPGQLVRTHLPPKGMHTSPTTQIASSSGKG